jgi:flagellar biosynthesis protein FliR
MLTHFPAVLVFALFVSIVFGITQRAEPKMMIRFGAFCFVLFVGAVIAMSWIMYFIKH